MNMLNRQMVPLKPREPFNPPLNRAPVEYGGTFICNLPHFHTLDGFIENGTEYKGPLPTHCINDDVVCLVLEMVMMWQSSEPSISIIGSESAIDSLECEYKNIDFQKLSEQEVGRFSFADGKFTASQTGEYEDLVCKASSFDTKTMVIRFKRDQSPQSAGHKA